MCKRNASQNVGKRLIEKTSGLQNLTKTRITQRIEIPKRLQRRQEQLHAASLNGRLAAAVDAENLCSVLDPMRGKIRRPESETDAAAIDDLIILYAVAQMLRLDSDQWHQFCTSEHWRDRRKRPRVKSEHSTQALAFVLTYTVADGKASVLTKSLNSLLKAFWEQGATAEQVSGLLSKNLKKKPSRRHLTLKLPDSPSARELISITDRTSITVKAVVHRDAKGQRVFDVQEVTAVEVLEPPLL